MNQAKAALGRLSSHTVQPAEELHKWGNMVVLKNIFYNSLCTYMNYIDILGDLIFYSVKI